MARALHDDPGPRWLWEVKSHGYDNELARGPRCPVRRGAPDGDRRSRALSAPLTLVADGNQLVLWNTFAPTESESRIADLSELEFPSEIGRLREDLAPGVLFAAKQSGRQLSFFNIDIEQMSESRRGTSDHFNDRVNEAMAALLDQMPQNKEARTRQLVWASQAVVQTIAALMVCDKYELHTGSLNESIEAAQLRFPGYFDWPTGDVLPHSSLASAYQTLREGINYAGLDPSIVSDVYESAVVSRSERLRLGIFYTPPELAKKIVAHIPFEEIPSEDRVVMDPACGSGTLLLAAHDRLSASTPRVWDPVDRHNYLVHHLVGYDADEFAVEIARLSLLLHALPAGNSWDVSRNDIYETQASYLPTRPSVVISNPPWKDIRSTSGVRHQVADDFLDWMVRSLIPGGFLAVVLPAGWMSGYSTNLARQALSERAEIFEVWRLPELTFKSSGLAPCVIFAQARATPRSRPYLFKRVLNRRESLDTFYKRDLPDFSHLSFPETGIRRTLLRGPFDSVVSLFADNPRLESLALVQNGPVPEPPVALRGGSGDFMWLREAGAVSAFSAIDTSSLVRARFPEDFHRAGTHDGSIFLEKKLLVSAKRRAANPWRIKVTVDPIGVIPRESLYMVIPNDRTESSLFALLAILGSSFASAWIDSYETKMAIDADLLRSLPMPPQDSWPDLELAGRDVFAAGRNEDQSTAIWRMEEAVREAYGLTSEAMEKLRSALLGFPAPEQEVRFESQPSEPRSNRKGITRFGATLSVEGEDLRLWVPGITPDKGSIVRAPDTFLGWHCVPGATFDVIGGSDLNQSKFTFQRLSHAPLSELVAHSDQDSEAT